MEMFQKWCSLRGEQAIPASPTIIARFIKDVAPMGIDRVWPAVLEISRAHYVIGLPDSTISFPVTAAMNDLSGITPPRSWPAEEKARFLTLPYDIQQTISKREADRDKQIRQMQNEFAKLKKEHEHASTKSTADAAA
jgi:hypothetical protein